MRIKNPRLIVWPSEVVQAFQTIKHKLVETTIPAFPQQDAFIDAPDITVSRRRKGKPNLAAAELVFKKLILSQRNYSTYSRELLAANLIIKYYWYSFDGR